MVERWDRYIYRISINGAMAVFRGRQQEGPNQWGFVPMVYFSHLRYAGTFAGMPLFAQLMGLVEELNGRMGDGG